MQLRSVFFYVSSSFLIGFLICLSGMTIEEVYHGHTVLQALARLHDYLAPILFGLASGLGGYLYRKNKIKQVEAVNRYADHLNSLLQINTAITSSIDLDVVLQTIVDQTVRLMGLETGAIYLTDGSTVYLGATQPPLPAEFPEILRHDEVKNHPHIGRALESGGGVILADATKAVLTPQETVAVKSRGLKSILYLPLIIGDRPVGILILGTVSRFHAFREEEILRFHGFSAQAALAIENARLFRESVVTAEELRSQNEEFVQLNSELAESEKHYRALFENSSDGIIYLDRKGGITALNDAAARMHGFEPEELLNRNIQDLDVEDQSQVMPGRMRRIDAGERIRFEVVHRHREGHLLDIEVSPYRVDLGGEPYYIAFHRDITARKRAQDELKRSEEKYRNLFNNSQVGMFRTVSDGARILEFNDKYLDILGYTREEVEGKSSLDFWVDPEERKAMVETVRANRRVSNFEFRLFNKSGEIQHCITSFALDESTGVLEGSVIDISDRKRAEEELRVAKEKAEESDRLKTAFLHNMSHEIRTPMNAILGFSELVFDEDITEENRQQYLSIVRNSGDQLLSIVNDILTISALETKQEKINIGAFDVNDMIRQQETIFRQQAAARGIRVSATTGLDDAGALILTDGTKVTQILSNLLSNALKFTLEGSVTFGVQPAGDFLEFFVSDTGIGIRPENHGKIFERFLRAHEYENRKFTGSGLGLSISRGFADLLGGRIWLESEPGVGSTFRFTVPYTIAAREA